MKKLLSVLFAVAMLVGCLGTMSVSAESGFSFSASQVSGFAGEEVQVAVSVNESIGITGVIYTLGYDAEVLELVSVSDEALLGGFSSSPTLQVNPYKCVYGQANNTAANGALTIFTFAIKKDAPVGATNLDLTVVQCTQDENNVSPAVIDGAVTVKAPVSSIESSSVTLGQDIAVNYYVDLCPADLGAQMKITMNGQVSLVDAQHVSGSEYKYTFTGIAPQCMGDNIKAELVKGGKVLDSEAQLSVRSYCQALFAKTAAELKLSEAKTAAMKTLIADLMEYGAAAQQYKKHNTGSLVNEGFTGATAFAPFENSDKYVEKTGYYDANMAATAAGVFFDYENSLYLKLNCKGYTANNSQITFVEVDPTSDFAEVGTKQTYTVDDCELLEDGQYCLKISVAPADFDSVYLFSMRVKPDSRWQASQNVYYSVNAYIYQIVNGGTASDGMVVLAKALYNYGVSASAYLNA